MPKRRFRPVRRRRRPGPWMWAGFAASAALGALTATLIAGSDDQPNPVASPQPTAGQLSDEVRRMITSYLEEEGYPPLEEPDGTEPDVVADPDLPAEPPVPIEPVPVAPAVAPAARTSPAAKTARPGAGPWPFAGVPDVALPRVVAGVGAKSPVLPPVEVPVALWQALDAPARREPEPEPAELRWTPEPVPPEPAVAPAEPLRTLAAAADPAGPAETPVESWTAEGPEPALAEPMSASVEPLRAADVPEPVEPIIAAGPSGEPVGRGVPEPAEPAAPVRSAPEVAAPAGVRVGRAAKHDGPDGSGSRHSGSREAGERVAGDADAVPLPAGER